MNIIEMVEELRKEESKCFSDKKFVGTYIKQPGYVINDCLSIIGEECEDVIFLIFLNKNQLCLDISHKNGFVFSNSVWNISPNDILDNYKIINNPFYQS